MTEPASLLEEIRFGYGPRLGAPLAPGGVDPDRVLAQLTATDPEAEVWTGLDLTARQASLAEARRRKQANRRWARSSICA